MTEMHRTAPHPPDRAALLANELILVRRSGKLPEPALHASLHFLEASPDGPRLSLTPAERRALTRAAAADYQDIIRRDLNPENRDRRPFRGLARALGAREELPEGWEGFCGKNPEF